jgi:hypothetical protein
VIGNTHKALFYEKYNTMFSSKISKTMELDEEKDNYIVQVKLNYRRMTTKIRTKSVGFARCDQLRLLVTKLRAVHKWLTLDAALL